MDVNANIVRELRDKTGAGVMDCKKALAESKGDLEKATVWLREKGIARPPSARAGSPRKVRSAPTFMRAASSACWSRSTARVTSSPRRPEFQGLVKDIAMQIAATNPRCVRREELPADGDRAGAPDLRLAGSRRGKPEQVIDKIVEGKLEKFYKDVVLDEQAWVRDPNRTITDLIGEFVGKLGREDRDSPLRALPARRRARRARAPTERFPTSVSHNGGDGHSAVGRRRWRRGKTVETAASVPSRAAQALGRSARARRGTGIDLDALG